MILELECSAGDLEDTLPVEGQNSAVGAAYQNLQLWSREERKGYTRFTGLPHPQREHAAEVVTTCSQNDSVD